ncbi:MAG: glucose-6-phosphate dehydrogenase [Thermoflexales bacterium]|nr:glucose-6-phosphate dehydrogenase [Thermoflexales bacterium]
MTLPDNCVMVIFGASGDLTHRKLIPALYSLTADGALPKQFAVVGFARKPKTDESFRAELRESVSEHARVKPVDTAAWEAFASRVHYCQGDYGKPDDYARLEAMLKDIDAQHGTGGNRLFYVATPPEVYHAITEQLGLSGMARAENGRWVRIIIEKPFGHDLNSARELNTHVHRYFAEDQIFRIDHYLGKETVQNILVFRFANGIFEPIWNRRYVDSVQITVAEEIGIEGRGAYYESAGVIRDIVQNHLLQLLALTAMEPPAEFEADAVRNEKVKVLKAIRVDDSEGDGTVRGQYGPGKVAGQLVPGYLQEEGVALDSTTETWLAMKFLVDNWRWAGVPWYVRSGKRMPKRVTEIAIQFKMPPLMLFSKATAKAIEPNALVLNIQPDEGISLKFGSKAPGSGETIQPVKMDFTYSSAFDKAAPDAYERLLLDCILGDSTLFTRADEVEAQWEIINPIIDGWKAQGGAAIELYRAGKPGPKEGDDFIRKDKRDWRNLWS